MHLLFMYSEQNPASQWPLLSNIYLRSPSCSLLPSPPLSSTHSPCLSVSLLFGRSVCRSGVQSVYSGGRLCRQTGVRLSCLFTGPFNRPSVGGNEQAPAAPAGVPGVGGGICLSVCLSVYVSFSVSVSVLTLILSFFSLTLSLKLSFYHPLPSLQIFLHTNKLPADLLLE